MAGEMQPFGPPRANGDVPKEPFTVRATVHPPPPPVPQAAAPPPPTSGAPIGTWQPSHYPASGTRVVTDQRQPDGAVVAIAWVVTVLTLGYMLPWAIAATRGKSNQGAVGLINLLLGWTFVGWVAALVMACQAHQVVTGVVGTGPTVVVAQSFQHPTYGAAPSPGAHPPAGWYPEPGASGQRYWDGTRWTEHRAP